jgi:hypothetical protein
MCDLVIAFASGIGPSKENDSLQDFDFATEMAAVRQMLSDRATPNRQSDSQKQETTML